MPNLILCWYVATNRQHGVCIPLVRCCLDFVTACRDISPLILNLGAGWEWSTSSLGRFAPWKEPQCSLYRRLSGPQCMSRRLGEEKNLLLLPEFEPRTFQPLAYYTEHTVPSRSVFSTFGVNTLRLPADARGHSCCLCWLLWRQWNESGWMKVVVLLSVNRCSCNNLGTCLFTVLILQWVDFTVLHWPKFAETLCYGVFKLY